MIENCLTTKNMLKILVYLISFTFYKNQLTSKHGYKTIIILNHWLMELRKKKGMFFHRQKYKMSIKFYTHTHIYIDIDMYPYIQYEKD